MTALEAFARKHAAKPATMVLAGLAGLGLFAGAATGFATTPTAIPTHTISENNAGAHLLRAADARIADQFADMKRVLDIVDSIADEPIKGADKMRAITQVARQFAATTPDDGAAAHDKYLFTVAKGTSSIDFAGAVDDLNRDKLELGRASLALRNIQFAMVVGDDEAVGNGMIELEAAIERYEARNTRLVTPTETPSNLEPIGVVTAAVMQYVEIDRKRIEVEIPDRRIDVSR